MSVQVGNHRLPKRSASHGTLRGSYTSHDTKSPSPAPMRPLHKPLRSVNENSALLQSPGALESMLKTTTETGDIGIFSIRPVPPSPDRRAMLSRNGRSYQSSIRSATSTLAPEDGKMALFRRDATSEILSMYTTDSQKSVTSSTLPSTCPEDFGHRSHSMTTCGSRHLSHHKSSATLQSQGSGSYLQRPRSPFPYPTRLKRPGVRPASPALTENGRVDYSRMVEIDRASYRTNGPHYKPSYTSLRRSPHPLGLRSDTNSSTPPMHNRPPPMLRTLPHRGGQSVRSISAASLASRHGHHRERMNSTSSRASSSTSVASIYHRMPALPHMRAGHGGFPPPMPRYYDYTEDFEVAQAYTPTFVQPVAPGTTRRLYGQRALVFLPEPEPHYAATFHERDSAFFEADPEDDIGYAILSQGQTGQVLGPRLVDNRPPSHRGNPIGSQGHHVDPLENSTHDQKNGTKNDIDLLPSQTGRDSVDTFNPSLDVESKATIAYSYPRYRASAKAKTKSNSPERQVQVQDRQAPTIRSEQGVILRDAEDSSWCAEDLSEGSDMLVEMSPVRPESFDCQDALVSDPELPHNTASDDGGLSVPSNGDSENTQYSEVSPDSATKPQVMQETLMQDLEVDVSKVSKQSTTTALPEELEPDRPKVSRHSAREEVTGPNEIDTSRLARDHRVSQVSQVSQQSHEVLEEKSISEGVSQVDKLMSEEALQRRFRRHRRNFAILKINTRSRTCEDSDSNLDVTPTCSTTPLLAPKPISPARQLKVKNSIPQLMKALPPLPGDPRESPPPTPVIPGDEEEFAEVLRPFSFSQSIAPRTPQSPHGSVSNLSNKSCLSPRRDGPKLRLRRKQSDDHSDGKLVEHRSQSITGNSVHTEFAKGHQSPGKPRRLRLKGHRVSDRNTSQSGTVRRYSFKHSSSAVESLTKSQPRDLFSLSGSISSAARHVGQRRPSKNQSASLKTRQSGSSFKFTAPVAQVEASYARSTASDISRKRPQKLRKRASRFRNRFSQHVDPVPNCPRASSPAAKTISGRTRSSNQFNGSESTSSGKFQTFSLGRRIRAKLSGLVKGAKATAKVYTRRSQQRPVVANNY